MNLLIDSWIPVRPLSGGPPQQLSLQALLCQSEHWTLCLPRDDMELSALQLLICLLQVTWIPKDLNELRARIGKPLTEAEFKAGVERWGDMFCLDHPDTPFM